MQGKIVRTSDASGSVIGSGEEQYIPAVPRREHCFKY